MGTNQPPVPALRVADCRRVPAGGTGARGVDVSGAIGIEGHLLVAEWRQLRAEIKAGAYDDLYPDDPTGDDS